MARRLKKVSKWRVILKFIMAMSLCLNMFGAYKLVGERFSKLPLVKREAMKLALDGFKYRYGMSK